MKKLKEWIPNEEFFNKMKIGFSLQKDGFSRKKDKSPRKKDKSPRKKDGFPAQKFHSKCDNKGETLVIIQTTDKYIFGGFLEIGFPSGDFRYLKDPNAFIFSLKNPNNNIPQKFKIQEGKEDYAIRYNRNDGPRFDFGATYSLPNGLVHGTDEARNYLAGSFKDWKIEEMEIYFI
ncbi:hypothetical protein M0811_04128 [Anaeramoeba ignava]|uniref:TLDc domain-containing protein n=1 Tax=Anaeramoeba ignava TaxID=1746090 RepID=A0A9Q0LXR7_ANAIG|nr:hypothetical protein M0811_04128 [Anaeramoeba ignava]